MTRTPDRRHTVLLCFLCSGSLFFPGTYRCTRTGHDQNLFTCWEDQGAWADASAKIRILQILQTKATYIIRRFRLSTPGSVNCSTETSDLGQSEIKAGNVPLLRAKLQCMAWGWAAPRPSHLSSLPEESIMC